MPSDPQPGNAPSASGTPRDQQRTAGEVLAAYASGDRTFAYWNLAGADLKNATLTDANFFRANLKDANLSEADLTRCNFSQAVLTTANLRGANISGAYFDRAVTFGADLTDTITDRPTPKQVKPVTVPSAQTPAQPTPASSKPAAPRFCTYCGAAIAADGSFCPTCGKSQPSGRAMSTPATPATPSTAQPTSNSTTTIAHPIGSVSGTTASSSQSTSGTNIVDILGDIVGLIVGLISTGWGLITSGIVVIGVIVFCVGLVRGVFTNGTLNEHSSCQQFGEADADAQTRVLQDMMKAHNTPSDELQTTRASVTLYCYIHGASAPIDGIYGSGFMNPSETHMRYANSLVMSRRSLVMGR